MASSRKIILDCDPGHDDAVAILLAVGNPSVDLLGVTTVGGNQTLEKVTCNALGVLDLCGAVNVPVHSGAHRPLVQPLRVAGDIHGETGLGGVELPAPTRHVISTYGAEFIVDTVMSAEPKAITLVGTAPLTNLAIAIRLEPRIVERVREVVVMGGGYHAGNATAVAEFNIWTDPEAAHIVFEAQWPLTMVGLDLTHQAIVAAEVEREIAATGSSVSEFFVNLMSFLRPAYLASAGFADPPLHDPCTVAYVIDPTVMQTRTAKIAVELDGRYTRGMTVVDLRRPAPEDWHQRVATELDRPAFWNMVVDAIRRLDAGSGHQKGTC